MLCLPVHLFLCACCCKTPQRGRAEDPVGYIHGAEQRARERQVAYETVRLLRQKVIHCYRLEGVNHYENCYDVAKEYYDLVSKKDLGQLQPKWATAKKSDGS
jgi:NADH-ubiquinone oxidoreductase subunit 10